MEEPKNHLLRVLGVAFGVAAVIGGTIGQGVLRSPGLVATGFPDARAIIALWIGIGIFSAIDAMSTVELACAIRRTGGPYSFAKRTFGPFAGLAVGLTDWLGNVSAIAFVSVVLGEYLHRMGIATGVSLGALAAALPLTLAAFQLVGTRVAGLSQEIGSVVKTLIFTALIAALLLSPRGAPVVHPPLSGAFTVLGMIAAIRVVVSSYNGWSNAAYFCEEVVDPRRTIARATFIGLAVVTLIYVLVNVALLQQMTPAEMAGDTLVAATAGAKIFGSNADVFITAISTISLVTVENMTLMTFARVLFAISSDRALPGLSRVAPNGTPRVALLATAAMAALLATIGVYDQLLALSAALYGGLSVGVNLAVIVLRRREPELERPYRMPFFPLPALIALTVNAALLVAYVVDDPQSSALGFAIMLALTVLVQITLRVARPKLATA